MEKRNVDVIVDLQFGSTGKGAVAAFLAKDRGYGMAVRVQSIQAGHTIYYGGKAYKMRTLPCAWVSPKTLLVLGAGCFIEKELLLREVEMVREATGKDPRDRIIVDPRAYYVLPEDEEAERARNLERGMGSTAHGAGASLIRKMWRDSTPTRVQDDGWAAANGFRVEDTVELIATSGDSVMVEGCQGTMLSIHTSPYYPFVTSREATAAGIIAEAGISPLRVRDVIGVFRSLPIRVGGNSGPTGGMELSWEGVNARAGREVEPERTTVTNRVRRIFEFSHKDFAHAMRVNAPTKLFMTFADYLAPGVYGKRSLGEMPKQSARVIEEFLNSLAERHDALVDIIFTGEMPEHFVRLRNTY